MLYLPQCAAVMWCLSVLEQNTTPLQIQSTTPIILNYKRVWVFIVIFHQRMFDLEGNSCFILRKWYTWYVTSLIVTTMLSTQLCALFCITVNFLKFILLCIWQMTAWYAISIVSISALAPVTTLSVDAICIRVTFITCISLSNWNVHEIIILIATGNYQWTCEHLRT